MSPSDFDRMGQLLRDHVDVPGSETARALLRARVVQAATRPPRRHVGWLAAAALPVLVGLVAGVLLVRWPDAQPISFHAGDSASVAQPGTWLAPAGDQPLSITFSEGSVVMLDPRARARIVQTTPRGAAFHLEGGSATFRIVHRPDTDWSVIAGPYAVSVRGTSFTVSWDAAGEVFDLTLESGSVVVRGPGIDRGIQLDGVQHFVGRPTHGASPAACATAVPSSVGSAAQLPDAVPPQPTVESMPRPSVAPPSSSAPARESWAALAAKGQYRTIVDEAEARGTTASISSASMGELWALAEAARLTGRAALARQALTALRSRFPGTSRAASAAFLLGRMSDDGGHVGDAIAWYDRYVAEAPGGAFVPEALGRRMVALRRSGNTAEAVDAASAYLRRFPNGPYAGVARDLVGQ